MIKRFLLQTAGSFEAATAEIDATGGTAGWDCVDLTGVVGSLGSSGLEDVLS
jgi:hypothetical protein